MTTALTAFLPEVMPYCPGVPDDVATNAIRNAAIEFCNKSHWLIYENFDITGVAGVSDYELSPPTDTTVTRVTEAWYDNIPLTGKPEEELRLIYTIDWRQENGTPCYYTQLESCELRLVPPPQITEVGALKVIAAIQPTRTCTKVADSLFERWLDTIACGARGRLYAIPGQSFTDFTAAGREMAWFRAGVNQAKMERNRGLTRAPAVMRPPRFI